MLNSKLDTDLQELIFHMLNCVIFDMDGLLIDSEPLWQDAEIASFARVGIKLTHKECTETTGLRIDAVVRYWFDKIGWSGMSLEAMQATIVENVMRLIAEDTRPKDGIEHIFRFFEERKFSIAVASSSPLALIHAVLEKLGLEQRLQAIHSAEFEAAGKPAPDIYLSTLKKLGRRPEEAIAFEDSKNGVTSALRAGIRCVCVPDPGSGNPAPDHATITIPTLRSFDDEILRQLTSAPQPTVQ